MDFKEYSDSYLNGETVILKLNSELINKKNHYQHRELSVSMPSNS